MKHLLPPPVQFYEPQVLPVRRTRMASGLRVGDFKDHDRLVAQRFNMVYGCFDDAGAGQIGIPCAPLVAAPWLYAGLRVSASHLLHNDRQSSGGSSSVASRVPSGGRFSFNADYLERLDLIPQTHCDDT